MADAISTTKRTRMGSASIALGVPPSVIAALPRKPSSTALSPLAGGHAVQVTRPRSIRRQLVRRVSLRVKVLRKLTDPQLKAIAAASAELAQDAALDGCAASDVETSSATLVDDDAAIAASDCRESAKPGERQTPEVDLAEVLSCPKKWDALPDKVRRCVLAIADPLTLFQAGRYTDLTPRGIEALWIDAFESDWQGDLRTLPLDRGHIVPGTRTMQHIRTRDMFRRVRALKHVTLAGDLTDAVVVNQWHDLVDARKPDKLAWSMVRCGAVDMLESLLGSNPRVEITLAHACYAARHDQVGVLQWIDTQLSPSEWTAKSPGWQNALEAAAFGASIECVKWVREHHPEVPLGGAVRAAAAGGSVRVIEFLFEHCAGAEIDGSVLCAAVRGGHLAALKWLAAKRADCDMADVANVANNSNEMDIVGWIGTKWPGALTAAMLAALEQHDGGRWIHEIHAAEQARADRKAQVDALHHTDSEEHEGVAAHDAADEAEVADGEAGAASATGVRRPKIKFPRWMRRAGRWCANAARRLVCMSRID